MNEGLVGLLSKPERSIAAASTLPRTGDADFAASRAYHAMFNTAEALLLSRGLTFGRRTGVHAASGKHSARPATLDSNYHCWILKAFTSGVSEQLPEAAWTGNSKVLYLGGDLQEMRVARDKHIRPRLHPRCQHPCVVRIADGDRTCGLGLRLHRMLPERADDVLDELGSEMEFAGKDSLEFLQHHLANNQFVLGQDQAHHIRAQPPGPRTRSPAHWCRGIPSRDQAEHVLVGENSLRLGERHHALS